MRVRHNSVISIKSDRSYKNDDIKNFENIVYIDKRGSIKYKTIKNVDNIIKSKGSDCREIYV